MTCRLHEPPPTSCPGRRAGTSPRPRRPGRTASRSRLSCAGSLSNCVRACWPTSAQQKSALIGAVRTSRGSGGAARERSYAERPARQCRSARPGSSGRKHPDPGRGALSPRPRVRGWTHPKCFQRKSSPVWSARGATRRARSLAALRPGKGMPARWSNSVFFATGRGQLPHPLNPENAQSNSEGHRRGANPAYALITLPLAVDAAVHDSMLPNMDDLNSGPPIS